MPPKRKAGDDSVAEPSSSTRSTRASTRASAAKNTSSMTAKSGAKKSTARGGAKATTLDGSESDGMESVQSAKKARTTATQRKTTTARRNGGQIDDEVVAPRKVPSIQKLPSKVSDPAPVDTPVPVPEAAPKAPPKSAPVKKASKPEPYTPQRVVELFTTYADKDDSSVIGPEGFEQLCTDADMSLEGTLPLIFAWQMGAKEMAKVTKEEWVNGMATLKISSLPALSLAMTELEDLLFRDMPSAKTAGKEYDRTSYNGYAANTKAAFQKLYMFSFNLVKPEQSKNIDMETSTAFWTVLLVPKFPIMGEVVEFINEKPGTYKATNKDLWSMMLEFCETVKPTLQDYDADAAWPTLLDDFVEWKTSHMNGNGKTVETMEVDQ